MAEILDKEKTGIEIYDYLVNNLPDCIEEMDTIVDTLLEKDSTGKYLASSARFLAGVDMKKYERWICRLTEGAIDRDKERRYIWSLLQAIWGPDYQERISELEATDNNFRRIYKRVFQENSTTKRL